MPRSACLGGPGRPVGGQQEAPPASEGRTRSSAVPTQLSSARLLCPSQGPFWPGGQWNREARLGCPRVALSRKSPSEYKLEGRSVSCLKPIEGTLDIALLSGPQASKTELPSPGACPGPSPGSDTGPRALALPNSAGRKADTAGQRESSPANFKVNKSYLLEPRFPPSSRGLQSSRWLHPS